MNTPNAVRKCPTRYAASVHAALLALLAVLFMPSCAQRIIVKQKVGSVVGKSVDLDELRRTWSAVYAGKASDSQIAEYNDEVADLLVKLAGYRIPDPGQESVRLNSLRGSFDLLIDPDGKSDIDIRNYDQVYVSTFLRIKRGLKDHVVTEGLGASLALRSPPGEDDPFISPEGLWRPATAIVEFNGRNGSPKLIVYDPLKRDQVQCGGHRDGLRCDFTAPLATGVVGQTAQIINIPAMLNFEKFEDKLDLFRISPLDPDKTVCLLVHGLKSSPATWRDTANEMLADPVIREKYEFWTYGYPTGAPIPYSAMRLREDIRNMIAFRRANGAETNNMIVIGHSMGGLLAKTLTQSSGVENWNRLFKKSVNELDVTGDQRKLLRDMVYFEPVPAVKRVVFVSTPHRGSDFASNPLGKVASRLIEMPSNLVRLSDQIMMESSNALTPLGLKFAVQPPTSIDQLREDSVLLTLLDNVPLHPNVTYHSIIGRKNLRDPIEECTDGVVSYWSAHIDEAVSEVVVNSDHGAHQSEEGIAEITRILRLHAGARD
ncbi:MAG: alpha/beta hydrolase [Verrucomicrobiales bacterium]|nr:alpha/beta hydrolase [Verrucomicrobiales bacterium]